MRRSPRSFLRFDDAEGFSLVEVIVATGLVTTAIVTLAQLFAISTRSNLSAGNTSYATVLAAQKIEELRALTWAFDSKGLPLTDTSTDTAVSPETPAGGTGLSASPTTALRENTPGYVDHVDLFGNKLGGEPNPPGQAIYTRRWSIQPLPANPNNTLIIQVLVMRSHASAAAGKPLVARLPEEARFVTAKTRKAQ